MKGRDIWYIPVRNKIGVGDIKDLPERREVEFRNRFVNGGSIYWIAITPKGNKYSVVDLRSLFIDHPMKVMRDMFDYWEAVPINKNGDLLSDITIRAKTAELLAEELANRDS